MLMTKRSPEQSECIVISKVRWALFVRLITVPYFFLLASKHNSQSAFKKKKKRKRKKNVDVSLNIVLTSITLHVNGSGQHKKSRIYRKTHFLHFNKQLSHTVCSSFKNKIVCKSWYEMCIRPFSRAKTRLSKPNTRTCIKHECGFTFV